MTWISEYRLVAAISEAGGLVFWPVEACLLKRYEKLSSRPRSLTDHPFGVNLIVMHPEIDALCSVICDAGVSHVILAGGMPRAAHITFLRDGGLR